MTHYRLSQLFSQRRYRQKRVAEGLCTHCNNRTVNGFHKCLEHRQKSVVLGKRRAAQKKEIESVIRVEIAVMNERINEYLRCENAR